jgi:hypothetical protein
MRTRAQRTSADAEFENFYVFKPTGQHEDTLNTVLDQVVSWGTAVQAVRP